jgi:NAD-dependent dihydropyrimidine dehydrogenase PreA subunit
MRVTGECSACLICIDECPVQAISVIIGKKQGYAGVKIDESICTDCGNCVLVCSMECIN